MTTRGAPTNWPLTLVVQLVLALLLGMLMVIPSIIFLAVAFRLLI